MPILYFHFNILYSMIISLVYDLILTFKCSTTLSITYKFSFYALNVVSKYFSHYQLSIYYFLSVYYVLLFVFCFYVPCITNSCYFDFIYYKIYSYCIFCSFKITSMVFICILCKFHSFIPSCMSTN